MARPVVDLPQPDLAHQAQRLAARHAEAHAVDRLHRADLLAQDRARRDREVDLQVLDLQTRVDGR